MPRTIGEYSTADLHRFIASYERAKKTEGGIFPLSALLVEQLRRAPSVKAPRDVLKFIVELTSEQPTATVTYGQVWTFLHPRTPWKGNHSVKVVSDTLNAVIAYCVRHNLPLVTTLVVQSGSGKLSEGAVIKTYEEARRYGYDVGPLATEFVAKQAEASRQLTIDMLPSD